MKKIIYHSVAPLIELFLLPFLSLVAIIARFFPMKNSIFIGMMHVNNLTYVAKAMRNKGYYVQVIPWMIPEHERGVIPYDIDLKETYPFLYSNFVGQYFLSFYLFGWAIFKFNVFVMPFQSRLLDRTTWIKWLELPLLHLAGKKVILNTFGGDVATPRLRRRNDLKYSLYDGYIADPNYQKFNEKAIARNTRVLEKQADCIISAIDHIDYLDRVDEYFHLRCIDTNTLQPQYETKNAIPVFVHAPNHRLVKGTDQIIEAIKSLNKRGFPCELRIVENTSNTKLLEIIKDSDAVIDQLLLGTYARLAIEAMALGKPVFCYLRKDLYQFNPIWKHCPIMSSSPDNIEQLLEDFIKMTQFQRVQLGKKGRKYVEDFHSLYYIGGRFHEIIQKTLGQ